MATGRRKARPLRKSIIVRCLILFALALSAAAALFWRSSAVVKHRSLPLQVQQLTTSLPTWASLNSSSWDVNLRYDATAEPLRLLNSFNISTVEPTKKTKRLPSGAFGQFGEDVFAYENFFWRMRDGIFLEMGALDGYSYSNTFLFEHYLGWRGILIEPGPKNYQRLQHNRPGALCLNLAVCNTRSQVHLIEQWGEGRLHTSGQVNIFRAAKYQHAKPVAGTFMAVAGGIYEFMAPAHRQRWHKKKDPTKLPLITCVPLGYVLERAAVKHINFFSLDVEGAELEVLRTIDFHKVSFDVIVLEARGDAEEKDGATHMLMESHGYVLYGKQANNFWYFRSGFNTSAHTGSGIMRDNIRTAAANKEQAGQ